MAAEICRTGKPLLLTGLAPYNQAKPAAAPPLAAGSKSKKKRLNGVLAEVKQVGPDNVMKESTVDLVSGCQTSHLAAVNELDPGCYAKSFFST